MILLRTSYNYGGFLKYYFKLQFSSFWSIHDKTSSCENANYKMYSYIATPPPPPQINKLNYTSRKKQPPEKSRTP